MKTKQKMVFEKCNNLKAFEKWSKKCKIFLEIAGINLAASGAILCIEINNWLIKNTFDKLF